MKETESILSSFYRTFVIRYGLVVIFIGIGMENFYRHEVEAIGPLAESNSFFFWTFALPGTRMSSNLTGIIEVLIGILIASRPLSANMSAIGSIGAVITFLVILSFTVFSRTQIHKILPIALIPYMAWKFFFLHFVMLGASVWTAYEAIASTRIN